MADLNEVLNLEVQCAKTGAKIQYKDEVLRPINEMYSGAPVSPSFRRKARAINEGSQSPRSPRSRVQVMLGNAQLSQMQPRVQGHYILRDGEPWYQIKNFDNMAPFFMSIVSDTNFWMFISTTGALTCGRVDASSSLFPYYTVDKIHDSSHITGPVTILHVVKDGKKYLWEPFKPHPAVYSTTRSVYKNMLGNQVDFEEVNLDLGISFSYTWCSCDKYGIVRKCKLKNLSNEPMKVSIVDGLQNIIPANTNGWLQDCMANLVDAYKWSEAVEPGIGLYCLFAGMSDRAEAVESLKATTVWQTGLKNVTQLLSDNQLQGFRCGKPVQAESVVRGQRGAFLVHSDFSLGAKGEETWMMVAEVGQTHETVAQLQQLLETNKHEHLVKKVDIDIAQATVNLKKIMGACDALQCTGDNMTVMHHFANVMFNCMRGGIFNDGYRVEKADVAAYFANRNTICAALADEWLSGFDDIVDYTVLMERALAQDDHNLTRLCMEYIPVTFSRRHGDPSRPWNKFSIVLKDEDGKRKLNYQGNWRDIFQNWEALTMSSPAYIESMLAKFVNATTIDGYNPYVVNKTDGINWECPEPDNPWATIGYWGDHQIIYLLKFLEWSVAYHPGRLQELLDTAVFSYANVPYEYLPWPKIVEDAKNTIHFNFEKNERINNLVKEFGTDGKLVLDSTNQVFLVTLAEKLLVPILSKTSNMVVDGGIWLNTQRPEWNDANNAIVGNGLSMVTLYYMRRYTQFMTKLFGPLAGTRVAVTEDVSKWMLQLLAILKQHADSIGTGKRIDDQLRRTILDALGTAASDYRWKVWTHGFGAHAPLPVADILEFMGLLQTYCDHSIETNRTESGLLHAYNILVLGPDTAQVDYLYEMLEGQVSALSSLSIKGKEAVAVFEALYASPMYRRDQHSFTLYPDRKLKGFMEKNQVPRDKVESRAVQAMLGHGYRSILYKDAKNVVRWGAKLCNAKDLKAALKEIPNGAEHEAELEEVYEATFNHRAFTGRSGTMFGFEGLGCIYWHMVSKLLLAAQELTLAAVNEEPDMVSQLRKIYFDVRNGIGFNKSPVDYGAFPCDPYSHTPGHAGAQQPGMTGQVKEEVITRWAELGLQIENGCLSFKPYLLRYLEFLIEPKEFEYVSMDGELTKMPLKAKQLAFTFCQVPIVYTVVKREPIIVVHTITGSYTTEGNTLEMDTSADIFARRGTVLRIEVQILDSSLC
uniref:Uncharacterized protein n=1 Tax=Eutreptiella gymnastica TaxID=73025 RepID=A0A7S1NGE4_9EUGL